MVALFQVRYVPIRLTRASRYRISSSTAVRILIFCQRFVTLVDLAGLTLCTELKVAIVSNLILIQVCGSHRGVYAIFLEALASTGRLELVTHILVLR